MLCAEIKKHGKKERRKRKARIKIKINKIIEFFSFRKNL